MNPLLHHTLVRKAIDELIVYISDKYNVCIDYDHIKEIRYLNLDTIEVKVYKPHEEIDGIYTPKFVGKFTLNFMIGTIEGCGFVSDENEYVKEVD